MWNKVVSKSRLSAFAILVSLSGCTTLSDCKYEVGQKIRTYQAWGEFEGCHDRCITHDYSRGWKAGFYDVATGGAGCPPVFAPTQYWKPPVFCDYDPCRRDDWYAGFQDGAVHAKSQPDHHYLQAYLPPQNCCPVQSVSCPEVIDEPIDFPLEHIRGDHGYLAPAMDVPLTEENAASIGAIPVQQPDVPAAESAKPEPAAVSPSTSEAYEKNPAPTTSDFETPQSSNSNLQQRLVRQYQEQIRKQANSSRKSLLKQLVLNAAQPSSEEGF